LIQQPLYQLDTAAAAADNGDDHDVHIDAGPSCRHDPLSHLLLLFAEYLAKQLHFYLCMYYRAFSIYLFSIY